ncbi:MAG: flagellar assembly protein FliW, partial [Myxococcota bacterium]
TGLTFPGFPDCKRFFILDHDRETPLKWFQSVDRPEVALLIVEPEQIIAGYKLEIPPAVLPFLGWKDGDSVEELCAFVILNVEGGELAANLRAPVLVHTRERRGIQLILEDPKIPLRYTIPAEA